MMSIALMRSSGCGSMHRSVFDNHDLEQQQEEESCSSGSIGRDSDVSDGEEGEVQSQFKGPLDTMGALGDVLPVRKGISSFYTGKSKSFTNLADVSSTTAVEDLAKPDDPYARKRRTYGNAWHHGIPPRDGGSGVLKRVANSELVCTSSSSPSSSSLRPPLHQHGRKAPTSAPRSSPPRKNMPWRSMSLSDLQCAVLAASNNN